MMVTLSDPARPLDPGLLDRPGGFAWWYVDLLDEAGNGFVIIWSFGLPFLPGYLGAARAQRPELPRSRPSLNIALYRGGRPSFYLLQEYLPEEAEWQPEVEVRREDYLSPQLGGKKTFAIDGVASGPQLAGDKTFAIDGSRPFGAPRVERWRFGRSTMESVVVGGARTVKIALACAVPNGSRELSGEIVLSGTVPQITATPVEIGAPRHEWSPLVAPGSCRARFTYGEREELRVDGVAYHDRNGGDAPLDRLGIAEWTWGRAIDRDQLQIYYVVWPESVDATRDPLAWTIRVGANGEVAHEASAKLVGSETARALYGMRYVPELQLFDARGMPRLGSRTKTVVDDGPFYLRTFIDVAGSGNGSSPGIAEWVRPSRVDLMRHRPFVKMRVHQTRGKNSFWLPLFSGPREGRVKRLLGLGE